MSWKSRLNNFCKNHNVAFSDESFKLDQEYEPNGPWICELNFPEVYTKVGYMKAAEFRGNGASKKAAISDVCRQVVLLLSRAGHFNAEKVRAIRLENQPRIRKERTTYKLGNLTVPIGLLQTRQRINQEKIRSSRRTGEDKVVVDPRDYQIKLFERAKLENTIIWLSTGTGKTLIACMLLQYYGYLNDITNSSQPSSSNTPLRHLFTQKNKISVFVVPRVPLVGQQAQVIRENTNLRVGEYFGEQGVNEWKLGRWEKEFKKKDCLVMTEQILLNLLQQNFLSLVDVNVLVVDECHNVKGGNPTSVVFKMYYSKLDKQIRPRILGLSATPYSTQDQDLEELMDSKIVTVSSTLRQEMSKYAPRAKEIKVKYRPHDLQWEVNQDVCLGHGLLQTCIARLKVCSFLCYLENCAIHQRKQVRVGQQINEVDDEDLEELQGNLVQIRQRTRNQLLDQASKYLGVRNVVREMGPLAGLFALKVAISQDRQDNMDFMEIDEEMQQVMMIDATIDLQQIGTIQQVGHLMYSDFVTLLNAVILGILVALVGSMFKGYYY